VAGTVPRFPAAGAPRSARLDARFNDGLAARASDAGAAAGFGVGDATGGDGNALGWAGGVASPREGDWGARGGDGGVRDWGDGDAERETTDDRAGLAAPKSRRDAARGGFAEAW